MSNKKESSDYGGSDDISVELEFITQYTEKNDLANRTDADISKFDRRTRLFGVMMKISGFSIFTHPVYRWFLRGIIWACAILCIVNIGMRTSSYRNPFFDITLGMLHLWVCISYEVWYSFMNTKLYAEMFTLIKDRTSKDGGRMLNIIGIIGLITTLGTATVISIGWLVPIFSDANTDIMHDEHTLDAGRKSLIYLMIHGVMMIVIIVPWACVCCSSVFMFFLLAFAYKLDVNAHWGRVLKGYAEKKLESCLFHTYANLRDRLTGISRHFEHLYAFFILTMVMLILSSLHDIVLGYSSEDYPKWLQDIFYLALGTLGIVVGLWTTCSITDHWNGFLKNINILPSRYPNFTMDMLPFHLELIGFYERAPLQYTVYGIPITRTNVMKFVEYLIILMVTTIVCTYYRNQ
jgi:hypothetical protein